MEPDRPYSNRELDHYFNDIREKFLGAIEEIAKDTKEIKIQTTKTNGRVTRLEHWRTAVLAAGGIITSVIIPYSVYYFLKLEAKVENINKTLSQYEITIQK